MIGGPTQPGVGQPRVGQPGFCSPRLCGCFTAAWHRCRNCKPATGGRRPAVAAAPWVVRPHCRGHIIHRRTTGHGQGRGELHSKLTTLENESKSGTIMTLTDPQTVEAEMEATPPATVQDTRTHPTAAPTLATGSRPGLVYACPVQSPGVNGTDDYCASVPTQVNGAGNPGAVPIRRSRAVWQFAATRTLADRWCAGGYVKSGYVKSGLREVYRSPFRPQ